MGRASRNGPATDKEAVKLYKLLESYDPYFVLKWLFPSAKPKELFASIRTIDARGGRGSTKAFSRDWSPLQIAFELVDAIACRRRVGAPSEAIVSEIRKFTSPFFNWAPCALLLTLRQLQQQSRSSATRRLLQALKKHYVDVLALGTELGLADGRGDGFHDWMKCETQREIRAFLAWLAEFRREVNTVKTPSGAQSRRPVNSFVQFIDRLACKRQVGLDPPADAAEASWIVIRGSVLGLDTSDWRKWRLSIGGRCKHPAVRKILDHIEEPKRRDEAFHLESLLSAYVGD